VKNPFDEAPPEIRDLGHFMREFNKESARGAALIAASRLEQLLYRIIRAFLCDCAISEELLTGPNAPLGTFSARINAALAMGLIERHEFNELHLIRKIRNEFGHSWRDVDFDTPKVTALCERLPWLGPPDAKNENKPRQRFGFEVCILLTDLLWREQLVARERRTQRTWTNKLRK
jgi:hypothetical protein